MFHPLQCKTYFVFCKTFRINDKNFTIICGDDVHHIAFDSVYFADMDQKFYYEHRLLLCLKYGEKKVIKPKWDQQVIFYFYQKFSDIFSVIY